jgi:protein-glutamine gamma-glutamyltransferase
VKRYCEISIHILVGTAFLALALTGRLDLLALTIFTPGWAVSFYRAIRGLPHALTASSAFYLSCGYVVLGLVDVSMYSRSLIGAAVHMVLFLELVKLHQEKSERDYLYLIILAFLKILAASSLTVDISFVGTLLLFLVALVSTLMSYDMYRSEQKARTNAREVVVALGSMSMWTTFGIIVIGGTLFFLIPRVGTGYFTRPSAPPLLLTGFSDSVELGQIGNLKQSSAVVMHARRVEGTPFAALRWRGVVLDTFNGITWSRKRRARPHVHSENSNYIFRRGPAKGELMTYEVLLEPLATTALFGPFQVRQVSGRQIPGIEVDADGAIFTRVQSGQRMQYRVQSEILQRPTARNKGTTNAPELSAEAQAIYLRLPNTLSPRIRERAEEITRDAKSPQEKVSRIEAYLRKNYKYSLDLTWNPGTDPLAEFLFTAKSGHCEYFASSMAVLLRATGVPTRLVNGFLMDEYNPVGDTYIIRQSDAHSWVEAYLPGTGWAEFDPTPPAADQFDTGLIAQLHNYADAVGFFWNTYVLTYDSDSQGQLFQQAQDSVETLHSNLQSRKNHWMIWVQSFVGRISLKVGQAIESGAIWIYSAVLLACIAAYRKRQEFWNRWWLYRFRRTGRVDERIINALFYRAVAIVGKQGPQRHPSETWREWIGIVPQERCRVILQRALEVFERARYGPNPSSPADVATLQEAVRELRSLLQ